MWSPPEPRWITGGLADPVGTARIPETLTGTLPTDPQRPPDLRPAGPVDPQVHDQDVDFLEPLDHAPSLRTRRSELPQVGVRVRHPRPSPPGVVVLLHWCRRRSRVPPRAPPGPSRQAVRHQSRMPLPTTARASPPVHGPARPDPTPFAHDASPPFLCLQLDPTARDSPTSRCATADERTRRGPLAWHGAEGEVGHPHDARLLKPDSRGDDEMAPLAMTGDKCDDGAPWRWPRDHMRGASPLVDPNDRCGRRHRQPGRPKRVRPSGAGMSAGVSPVAAACWRGFGVR